MMTGRRPSACRQPGERLQAFRDMTSVHMLAGQHLTAAKSFEAVSGAAALGRYVLGSRSPGTRVWFIARKDRKCGPVSRRQQTTNAILPAGRERRSAAWTFQAPRRVRPAPCRPSRSQPVADRRARAGNAGDGAGSDPQPSSGAGGARGSSGDLLRRWRISSPVSAYRAVKQRPHLGTGSIPAPDARVSRAAGPGDSGGGADADTRASRRCAGGRKRQAVGGAEGFAETAFDAAIHEVSASRKRPEFPEMGRGSSLRMTPGETVFGVEQAL